MFFVYTGNCIGRKTMINSKKIFGYFSRGEKALWLLSVFMIALSTLLFDKGGYGSMISSVMGVTAIIFIAKGNPIGQLLMVIFSITYGVISYAVAYYGEMATYLGMTAPMAVFSLLVWLKNPYKGRRSEVKVSVLRGKDWGFLALSTVVVTAVFYFILKYFNTASLIVSTFSVSTSYAAAYLTMKRSPYFAIAYALNDVVLIVLWIIASLSNVSYLSVVICFVAFLFNDTYSYVSWRRMEKRQSEG